LAVQDFSQLKKDYGKDQSDVIMNIAGNIISGQVMGDTAKQLSERFGKIMQPRTSGSINSSDSSISHSLQMDLSIPPSKIASLSSGEFVGMVADDPDCPIDLKSFHCKIINDHDAIKNERDDYKNIPLIRTIDDTTVQKNYLQIKQDVQDIVYAEMDRVSNNPELTNLLVKTGIGRE
jgi:hypothetical protein